MGILKEAIQFYKDKKLEEKQKRKLLSSKSDYHLLEQMIQRVNENPELRVEIFLNDGTRILLKTYEEKLQKDYLDSDYVEVR